MLKYTIIFNFKYNMSYNMYKNLKLLSIKFKLNVLYSYIV